jgi:signal transduction histidine kinase
MPYRSTVDRRAELTIVWARIALAGSTLFALWLDQTEPVQFRALTYVLHWLYVLYAVGLGVVVWNGLARRTFPLATHIIDIVVYSTFHVLTQGPSSPFYSFFLFSMFCGTLRWGRRGTVITAATVLTIFLAIGLFMSLGPGPAAFEVNLFVIRSVYLAIAAVLLAFLGIHEARLRGEIQRLADWPRPATVDPASLLQATLAHAAEVVGARRAVLIWDTGDEPWTQVAWWQGREVTVERVSADESPAAGEPFLHPRVQSLLGAGPYVSAPLPPGRVSGAVFFADVQVTGAHSRALAELVARELASSLTRAHTAEESRQMAVREERIAVSRDLHDGVLQAMTGIRLELNSIGEALSDESRLAVHDRMADVERALAAEQRELRSFIEGLRPATATPPLSLAQRLEQLQNRLAPHRHATVVFRLTPPDLRLPPDTERALLMMVHEAVANALKHAAPSQVVVDIDSDMRQLRVHVTDDGRGFGFEGRYEHETLERDNLGPVTLRERAAKLGGKLSVETSKTGSRIELLLPVQSGGS